MHTSHVFHCTFIEKVIPILNPWPHPRSVAVVDNARIHMYRELVEVVHSCGAILLFLPPYSPHLNHIEVLFGRLKQWLVRHANLAFPLRLELVLGIAMVECAKAEQGEQKLFHHCGYGSGELVDAAFSESV